MLLPQGSAGDQPPPSRRVAETLVVAATQRARPAFCTSWLSCSKEHEMLDGLISLFLEISKMKKHLKNNRNIESYGRRLV